MDFGQDGYPRLEGLFGLRMHTFIWHLENPELSSKGKVIDHINRDRLDNRIENLRLILPIENNWNRTLHEMSNIKRLKKGFRVSMVRGGEKLSTLVPTLEEAIMIREAHRF